MLDNDHLKSGGRPTAKGHPASRSKVTAGWDLSRRVPSQLYLGPKLCDDLAAASSSPS